MLTVVLAAAVLFLIVIGVWISFGWVPALWLWGSGLVIGLCLLLVRSYRIKRLSRAADGAPASRKSR